MGANDSTQRRSPRPPAPPPPPPPERLGAFRLLDKLGKGGMGAVYVAEAIDDRPVYARRGDRFALKVLHDRPQASKALRRFAREFELGRRIVHENVVRAHELCADEEGDQPHVFIVMELVRGEDLRTRLSRERRLDGPQLRDLALQAASGLAAIHAAGAVHRDVKPANLLIDRDHRVKLADLGIVLLLDDEDRLTTEGSFLSTPEYAAPEQFTSRTVEAAADLYSLGVVLYEAATGVRPPPAGGESPALAGQIVSEVSPFLEEVLAWLLERDPRRRPASADELIEVLEDGKSSTWWQDREAWVRASHPRGALRRARTTTAVPLVGRDAELQALEGLHRQARGGAGSVVLVEGEDGMGRTAMLDELATRLEAAEGSGRILRCACEPAGPQVGPGALGTAIVDHVGLRALRVTLDRHLVEAPRLVAPFHAYLTAQPPPAGMDPPRPEGIRAAFSHLVRGLASEGATTWLIDDVQFATDEDRALLGTLARLARDEGLLVVLTGPPGLPAELLAGLERTGALRRIPLSRLGESDVETIVRSVVRSPVVAARLGPELAARAQGNPHYVLELLRALEEQGPLRRRADGGLDLAGSLDDLVVPPSVRHVLAARIESLSHEDRQLVDAASVQGLAFDTELLATVLGRTHRAVLEDLTRLARRGGLVKSAGAGYELHVRQLRDLLYQELPPPMRAEYHRHLARAFQTRNGLDGAVAGLVPGEDAVFLTEHLLRGGDAAAAQELLTRALDHLTVLYHHDALLALCALALRALPADAAGPRRDVLLHQLDSLDLLRRRSEQLVCAEAAVEASERADDPAGHVRALCALGRVLSQVEQLDRARETLELALKEAERQGDRIAESLASGRLGTVLQRAGRKGAARELFERSLAAARGAGHQPSLMRALGLLGLLDWEEQAWQPARSRYEQALLIAAELGDRWSEAVYTNNLGLIDRAIGSHAAAKARYERHAVLCRQAGYREGEVNGIGNLGYVHLQLGDARAALECFEKQKRLAEQLDYDEGLRKADIGRTLALEALGASAPALFRARARAVLERLDAKDGLPARPP